MTVAIFVTDQAMEAVKASVPAEHTFRQTGEKQANGMWRVPVDDDVFKILMRLSHAKSISISDTILLVCNGFQA